METNYSHFFLRLQQIVISNNRCELKGLNTVFSLVSPEVPCLISPWVSRNVRTCWGPRASYVRSKWSLTREIPHLLHHFLGPTQCRNFCYPRVIHLNIRTCWGPRASYVRSKWSLTREIPHLLHHFLGPTQCRNFCYPRVIHLNINFTHKFDRKTRALSSSFV